MDELLEILAKIDELTSNIQEAFSNVDLPLTDKLREIENILSNIIGQDAVEALNRYTEQYRNLQGFISEIKNEMSDLVAQNYDLERNFRPFVDLLNSMEQKVSNLKGQQLIFGDLQALSELQKSFSNVSEKVLNIDLNISEDKLRQLKEKYSELEIDTIINETRRNKIESFNYDINQILSQPLQALNRPLQSNSTSIGFDEFNELFNQSRRLANAFSYFYDNMRLAGDASLRTTDSLRVAARNMELAANRQLQFASYQFQRGEIDRQTFDLIKQSIEEGITRINAELPKELRIKLLDEDILKSNELVTPDTIARAIAEGRTRETQLSPQSYLDVLRGISTDLNQSLQEKLSAFTTYREKLGVTGHTNDPLSAMMFIGMSYQEELNPAIQRFIDKIKEFDSLVANTTPFRRQARNEAELLLNQKLLEAHQLRETRISEGKRLYETGRISERDFNAILKEADNEFRRLVNTVRQAQLSFNAIASIENGLRPIQLVNEDVIRRKLQSGETQFTLDEIRKETRTSGFRQAIDRMQAELYQGAIAIRDMFAKVTANMLMNTAWTVSFTLPMAFMNSLIFEPYMRTRAVLEPAFTGIGQVTGVPQAVDQIVNFVGGGFVSLANDIFDKLSSLTAIYRSPQIGQQVIDTALQVARYQPIQFSEATELLRAFAVFPGTRAAIGTNETSRRQLLDVAQYLQMLSPEQGVSGAIIALREFFSGEFRSMRMRFEIDPESLAVMANTTVSQMLSAPADKKIEILYTALSNLLGKEALFYKGANVEFQIQNLTDVLQQTVAASFATQPVPILTAYYTGQTGQLVRRNMEEELRSRGYSEDEIQRIVEIRLRLRQTLNGAIAGIIEDFNNAFSKYLTSTNVSGRASNFLARFILQIQQAITQFDENIELGRPDSLRIFVRQISQSLVDMINSLESEFENNEDIQVITESIGNVVSKMVQKMFVSTTQIVGQVIAGSLMELPSTFFGVIEGSFKAGLKVPNRMERVFSTGQGISTIDRYLLTLDQGKISYKSSNNIYDLNTQVKTSQELQNLSEAVKTTSENLRQFSNVLTLIATALTPGGLVGKSAAFIGLSTGQGVLQGTRFENLVDTGLTAYIGYQLMRFVSRNVSNLPEGYSKLGIGAGIAGVAGLEYLKYQQGQNMYETIGNLLVEGTALALAANIDKLRNLNLGTRIGAGIAEFGARRASGAGLGAALRAGAGYALAGALATPIKHPLITAAVAGGAFLLGTGLTYYGERQEEEKLKEGLKQVRQSILKSIEYMLDSMSKQAEQLVTTDMDTFYARLRKDNLANIYETNLENIRQVGISRQIPIITSELFRGQTVETTSYLFGGYEDKIKPEAIFQTFQTIVDTISGYTNRLVRVLQNASKQSPEAGIKQIDKNIEQIQRNLIDIRNKIFQQLIIQNPNLPETEASDIANRALILMVRNINEATRNAVVRNAEYLKRVNELYSREGVVENLFRISSSQLKLPELNLDLTGNIEQQIKAFVKKVDDTINKAIENYTTSLQITEESFTFGDKLKDELEQLNERINTTLDNLFSRFTSVGRKLGFLTPEQEYATLQMRERLAQQVAQTSPQDATKMFLSLAQEYYRMGDIQSAYRVWNTGRNLIFGVPGQMIEDFQRRYMLNAPPEIRQIPREYFSLAQNVAEYDTEQAIKLAQRALQVSRRFADTETYQQTYNFLQGLLQNRANPAIQMLREGGRTEYIRRQILQQTSPEIVDSQAQRQLSLLQRVDNVLQNNIRGIGQYDFPLTRQSVVSLDAMLAKNINDATGAKTTISINQTEALKNYLFSGGQQQTTEQKDALSKLSQYMSGLNLQVEFNKDSQETVRPVQPVIKEIEKVKDETGGTVYRISQPISVKQPVSSEISEFSKNLGLPNVSQWISSMQAASNQFIQEFQNLKPEFLWKPSTSDKSLQMTQSFFGEQFNVEPTLRPVLDSINFFGIESGNVLPNVNIPRDVFLPVNQQQGNLIPRQEIAPQIGTLGQSDVVRSLMQGTGENESNIISITANIVNIQTN